MPGVSAKQKSVRDFFLVKNCVSQTGVISGQPETLADSADEYLLCEPVLEREYRIAMVNMLQLRWKYLSSLRQELGNMRGVMSGCDVSCDNIVVSKECEQTVAELNDVPGKELSKTNTLRKYTPKMRQRGGGGKEF